MYEFLNHWETYTLYLHWVGQLTRQRKIHLCCIFYLYSCFIVWSFSMEISKTFDPFPPCQIFHHIKLNFRVFILPEWKVFLNISKGTPNPKVKRFLSRYNKNCSSSYKLRQDMNKLALSSGRIIPEVKPWCQETVRVKKNPFYFSSAFLFWTQVVKRGKENSRLESFQKSDRIYIKGKVVIHSNCNSHSR